MSQVKIQETANGGAQLSQGQFFLIANKFRINKGANKGKALLVVKISKLESLRNEPETVSFTEIKSWLLTPKEFDSWIALLMQVSNRELTKIKDGEQDATQKRF